MKCFLLPILVAIGAGDARFLFLMARDASAHADIRLLPQRIPRLHWTVTGAAFKPGMQVAAVAEIDVAGYLVDTHPRDRFLLVGETL